MPSKSTTEKAQRDLAEGKRPSTAAGEFVREEIEHVREGKHGARSSKQAIAIGLSKARRAGVPLKPPPAGRVQPRAAAAELAYQEGQGLRQPRARSAARGRAVERALEREETKAASRPALAAQARGAAAARSDAERSRSAKQGAATKGSRTRSRAAKQAAATRRGRRRLGRQA